MNGNVNWLLDVQVGSLVEVILEFGEVAG